jgi:hypothetical protein
MPPAGVEPARPV